MNLCESCTYFYFILFIHNSKVPWVVKTEHLLYDMYQDDVSMRRNDWAITRRRRITSCWGWCQCSAHIFDGKTELCSCYAFRITNVLFANVCRSFLLYVFEIFRVHSWIFFSKFKKSPVKYLFIIQNKKTRLNTFFINDLSSCYSGLLKSRRFCIDLHCEIRRKGWYRLAVICVEVLCSCTYVLSVCWCLNFTRKTSPAGQLTPSLPPLNRWYVSPHAEHVSQA